MSWLEDYVTFAKNNEAPAHFHWWTGITTLGAALRRNVYFSRGYYTVFPCIWTLIISPSGTKKTTAVSVGHNILSKMDNVRILADKNSPEGLALSLAEAWEGGEVESQGLIYAPELANFLDKRQHNEGLVSFLLRLADAPDTWRYRTKGGGIVTLKNVGVTFLGATADDLLYDCIPPLALKSGFLARFICISVNQSAGVVPFPWKDVSLEANILNGLYELSLLKGEMRLPTKAQEWYIAWYFRHKAESSKLVGSKLRAYYERKPDHLLRLAMLLSIAKHKRLEFSIEAFKEALEKLEELEPGLLNIYKEIDITPTGKDQMLILKFIERAGGELLHSDLMEKILHLIDSSKIKSLIQGLVEAKFISVERAKGGKGIVYISKGGLK